MPVARCYSAACALKDKIYVFGGTSGMWATAEKDVYVYDIQTDKWTQKNDMPYAIGVSAVTVVANTIYLLGDLQSPSSPPKATVMAYNAINESWTQKTVTDTWVLKSPMQQKRTALVAGVIGWRVPGCFVV